MPTLYFAPMSCSLAVRTLLNEIGEEADFVRVDLRNATLPDGASYADVNRKGQVPALVTDEGQVLTEVGVILQYLADRKPDSGLVSAPGTTQRLQEQEWLSFISGEIHKLVFYVLYHPQSSEGAKEFARTRVTRPFDLLNEALENSDYLTGKYSIADIFLAVALCWPEPVGISLQSWPNLARFRARMLQREAVTKAFGAERALLAPAS